VAGKQYGLPFNSTSHRPSLAATEPDFLLWAAWRGVDPDQNIYFTASFDGKHWPDGKRSDGTGSSVGPSLAFYSMGAVGGVTGRPYAAWKGVDGDQGIYWSSWDGQNWAPQQKIDGAGTSVGPSLAAFNNSPYAAWKGVDGDEKIYWSSAVPR
jgi:hypothetical protein